MNKKIGWFLMFILVIWSVLLLDATKNRKPPRTAVRPVETTQAFSQPPSTETVPPETTVPATAPRESQTMGAVAAVLDRHTLDRTAVTHLVRGEGAGELYAAALAELAAQREMNPIAGFWLLESEGLYDRAADQPGLPAVLTMDIPEQTAKEYPYTDAGAALLLTDLLSLAEEMSGGLRFTESGTVESGQVSLSVDDGCQYAYFAWTGEGAAGILCFYLRSDDRGERIDDVEFQLLYMTDGAEPERGDGQAAALAAAAELLMTGTHHDGREETAGTYEVSGFTARAERFFFTAETEQGYLTNYRLKK